MPKKMGVSLLGLMGTGYAFQFYTIGKPAISADGDVDMSGMRIRGGPSYDAMYNALGIIRVDIPAGDIYTALERKVVDGIGFTTIGVSSAGWQDFLRYRIFPTWRQGNTIIAMNAASRDRPTAVQADYLPPSGQNLEAARIPPVAPGTGPFEAGVFRHPWPCCTTQLMDMALLDPDGVIPRLQSRVGAIQVKTHQRRRTELPLLIILLIKSATAACISASPPSGANSCAAAASLRIPRISFSGRILRSFSASRSASQIDKAAVPAML